MTELVGRIPSISHSAAPFLVFHGVMMEQSLLAPEAMDQLFLAISSIDSFPGLTLRRYLTLRIRLVSMTVYTK